MNGRRLASLALLPLAVAFSVALAEGRKEPQRAAPADWPQWRGPNRDAVSAETGLVDSWGAAGPTVRWRIKAGEGYSSVTSVGGRLYTMWDETGHQLLVSLDPSTGTELWRRDLGPAFSNHYGNGPRSTPLVADGTVYAIGTSGVLLAARSKDGETVWQRDLVADFGARLPVYGYSSSPIAVGTKLVLEAGGPKAAFVALDGKTGATVWTSESDRPAYSSPIHVTIGGVEQVVFWSGSGVRALDAASGKLLWSHPWETLCPATGEPLNSSTPVYVAPDRIFLSTGSGASLLRIAAADGRFAVSEVWTSGELRSDVNTALALGDRIYGFDRGTLKALDVATGAVRWSARGFQRGSLVAADGKLIVLGESGTLALLSADPDRLVERAKAPLLSGRSWTAPSLADGRLYLRGATEIVCVDLRRARVGG